MQHSHRPGFTLIELIIVVAIIGIIAAVVFVAVDPAKRINASRNSTRWSDVTSILNAIKTYQSDSGGLLPSATLRALNAPTSALIIGTGVTCAGYSCPNAVTNGFTVPGSNCSVGDFTLGTYLKRVPYDPNGGNTVNAQYYVNKDANGLISVGACNPQGEGAGGTGAGPNIQVSG